MTTELLVVLCAVLLVACALGAGYFLVVVPSRWRVPLGQALALLERDERADLEAADRLLNDVMNAGPRGRDLADARFAHAFVHAKLGGYDPDRYWAAAASVDALVTAAGHDAASAYLAVWLHNRLDRHERAVDLYNQHAGSLANRSNAARAAAASHLHLAAARWRRRETDGAMHHFDRVRELGELTDQIPKAAENLHILKGIQSVFDQRHEDARAAFKAARERAEGQQLPTVEAELGLLACDWPENDPKELGERLAAVVPELVKYEDLVTVQRVAGQRVIVEGAVVVLAPNGRKDPDGQDPDAADKKYGKLLRAAAALLRLVALLREWKERPPLSGAPGVDNLAELVRRARALRDADPEQGDAHLVEGLMLYYFALNEAEREKALTTLEEGIRLAKGIVVPEVHDLVERERALGGQGDALARFLRLVYDFLADPTISDRDRAELRRIRDQFARYGDNPQDGKVLAPHHPASGQDLQRRIEALSRRIEFIVYPRLRDLPEDDASRRTMEARQEELNEAAVSYTEQTESFRRRELDVVMKIAEFLLPQDEKGGGHAAERGDPPDEDPSDAVADGEDHA